MKLLWFAALALVAVCQAAIAAPTVSNANPSAQVAGGTDFAVTVNGSGFASGSTVLWNGEARATTYASSKKLTATVRAADTAVAGSATVAVRNLDGSVSNAVGFTVKAAATVYVSANSDIMVMSADYATQRKVIGPVVGPSSGASPSFAPDGQSIVFANGAAKSLDRIDLAGNLIARVARPNSEPTYRLDATTGAITVTYTDRPPHSPKCSPTPAPDGRYKIAFIRERYLQEWIYDAQGNLTNIFNYVNTELCLVDLDGADEIQLTNDGPAFFANGKSGYYGSDYPTWTPPRPGESVTNRIAAASDYIPAAGEAGGNALLIYELEVDPGTSKLRIASTLDAMAAHRAKFPNSPLQSSSASILHLAGCNQAATGKIAFATYASSDNAYFKIWTITIDPSGGDLYAAKEFASSDARASERSPTWSPDDATLLFDYWDGRKALIKERNASDYADTGAARLANARYPNRRRF